jgi:hypothetical protein
LTRRIAHDLRGGIHIRNCGNLWVIHRRSVFFCRNYDTAVFTDTGFCPGGIENNGMTCDLRVPRIVTHILIRPSFLELAEKNLSENTLAASLRKHTDFILPGRQRICPFRFGG